MAQLTRNAGELLSLLVADVEGLIESLGIIYDNAFKNPHLVYDEAEAAINTARKHKERIKDDLRPFLERRERRLKIDELEAQVAELRQRIEEIEAEL